MKYELKFKIDEIILEGGSLSRSQRNRLQEALEAELLSLVRVKGLPPQLQRGVRIAKLPVTPNLSEEMTPTEMGQAIAH